MYVFVPLRRAVSRAPLLLYDASLNELFHLIKNLVETLRTKDEAGSRQRVVSVLQDSKLLCVAFALGLLEQAARLEEKDQKRRATEEATSASSSSSFFMKEQALLMALGNLGVMLDAQSPVGEEQSVVLRSVFRELASRLTSIVLRHRKEVKESLSLLASAFEGWVYLGRKAGGLAAATREALNEVADATLEALRGETFSKVQSAKHDASLFDGRVLNRDGPCPFELKRLSTALAALKHVSLEAP